MHHCKECGRSFGRAESLRRHLLIHSGEKPYKCTNCDYSSAQSQTLRRHMARRHREGIHLKKEKGEKATQERMCITVKSAEGHLVEQKV